MSIIAGAIGRFVLARGAASYLSDLQMPGFMPVIVAGFVLLLAAMIASALPAARAALIDAMEALQTD
jgi:ABC-type lipoprotein release transport system permease subunit